MSRLPALARAIALGAFGSTVSARADTSTVEELVERGFQLVAQGELIEANLSTCFTLRINGEAGNRCSPAGAAYGRFRRLAKGEEAFVCVSFRNWACFRSETGSATVRPAETEQP